MNHLYNVMTKQTKGKLVNFRVQDDFKREFEAVAEIRRTTLSGLIHQLLFNAVQDEKIRDLQAFNSKLQEIFDREIEGKELATKSKKKIPIDRSGAEEKKNAA